MRHVPAFAGISHTAGVTVVLLILFVALLAWDARREDAASSSDPRD